MSDDLPVPQNSSGLPSFRDWLSGWLGFQVPSVPMPQTLQNLDKAVGKVLLASGENAEARIKANTGQKKAAGKIAIEGLYRTEEEKRKLENRAATVQIAVDEMNETPSTSDAKQEIDDDWLNIYARLAEDKSSNELRSLFGKILAGEIRKPGSYSLRTLQFISTLSRDDAHQISAFFSFAIDAQFVPLPEDANNEKEPGLPARILMAELGIATSLNQFDGLVMSCEVEKQSRMALRGHSYAILVVNESDETLTFSLPCQFLSKPAQELFAIANSAKPSDDFIKDIAQCTYDKVCEVRNNNRVDRKIIVTAVEAIPAPGGFNVGRTIWAASGIKAV